jgi:hypothetical protein
MMPPEMVRFIPIPDDFVVSVALTT